MLNSRIRFKLLILAGLLLLLNLESYACNVCGSGSSSNYNGILPQYKRNVLALRYRYRGFDQYDPRLNLESTYQYQTIELWTRLYLKPRLQLFINAPFTINTLSEQNKPTVSISEMSDISANLYYNIINTTLDTVKTHKVHHNWLIGGGIKLPTGKYQKRNPNYDLMYAPNFQAGSGAYSFSLASAYNMRFPKWGINADVNYVMNLENELKYTFGNILNSSLTSFLWLKAGSLAILPNAGVYFEYMQKDIDNGRYNELTGGYALNAHLGCDVYAKNVFGGITTQMPFSQSIGSDNVTYKPKLLVNVGIFF